MNIRTNRTARTPRTTHGHNEWAVLRNHLPESDVEWLQTWEEDTIRAYYEACGSTYDDFDSMLNNSYGHDGLRTWPTHEEYEAEREFYPEEDGWILFEDTGLSQVIAFPPCYRF